MFTCESCHRQKYDGDRVLVSWVLRAANSLTRADVSLVCRDCSGQVKRTGLYKILAIVAIVLIALVGLHMSVMLIDQAGGLFHNNAD